VLYYQKTGMDESYIRQKIQREISKTEKLILEYAEQTKPIAPDCAIGRVSRMDAINNKSVTEASLRVAKEKLSNLERVFSLLGTRDFGLCLKCKKPIPVERILVRPESLYCIHCAR
jgi:DnaK suppressor protein